MLTAEAVEAVIPAIARATHVYFFGQNDPTMQLLNYLREKHILLILDMVMGLGLIF